MVTFWMAYEDVSSLEIIPNAKSIHGSYVTYERNRQLIASNYDGSPHGSIQLVARQAYSLEQTLGLLDDFQMLYLWNHQVHHPSAVRVW